MNEQKPIRLLLAVLAGVAASALGAWFWMKINTIPPNYIIYPAGSVAIGLIVGAAIRGVFGRPDIRLAVLAGLLTACGEASGYYWSRWEQNVVLAKANGYGGVKSISIPLSSIPITLWLVCLIGIYVACSLVMRKRQAVGNREQGTGNRTMQS